MELHFTSNFRAEGPLERCATIRILIVDREPAFRSALASMLREDGHDVCECPDAGELPRLDVLERVDVLLCAHEMPVQNGLWLADRLHGAHPGMGVILLVTYRPLALDRELAARPFVRLVEKPVPYDVLHRLAHDVTPAS